MAGHGTLMDEHRTERVTWCSCGGGVPKLDPKLESRDKHSKEKLLLLHRLLNLLKLYLPQSKHKAD